MKARKRLRRKRCMDNEKKGLIKRKDRIKCVGRIPFQSAIKSVIEGTNTFTWTRERSSVKELGVQTDQ